MRRQLQEAALKLYQTKGYDLTTTADIAAEAGVTQRTFFRHFPDKREVLFGGDAEFIEALTAAIDRVPAGFGPWKTLLHAFRLVEPLFVENRPFSAPRQQIIASQPTLQERAQAKAQTVITALAAALRQRGVPDRTASLAAEIGMVALGHAVKEWFGDSSSSLNRYVEEAFASVQDLASATGSV